MAYYGPSGYLDSELRRQGIPIIGISGPPVGQTQPWTVHYDPTATDEQKAQGDAFASSFDGLGRQSRLLYDIWVDFDKLTGAQKQAVLTDLTGGSPPKWRLNRGPNAGSMLSIWVTSQTTVMPTPDKNLCKQALAVLYTQDNPYYLLNPTFDPTINVSALEPAPPPAI